jgi:predicted amidohydrolase
MRVVLVQPGRRSADGSSQIAEMGRLIEASGEGLGAEDVVVLPELIGGESDAADYVAEVRTLASRLGAWVVGGSHYRRSGGHRINAGAVSSPLGEIAAVYEKRHPYGGEAGGATRPGQGPASFRVGDVTCLAMICADFWHAGAFAGTPSAELILVPAFSTSQRPEPRMARARWRHAMVARAYELAAFVAVSDWAHPVAFGAERSSGVAGLAHPNPATSAELLRPLGRRRVRSFALDLQAVHDFRANRRARGFDLVGWPGPAKLTSE